MTPITLPIAEMNSIDLPPVCVSTGAQSEVTFRKVKFAWYPRWVGLLIFFPYGGFVLAVIVAGILTKRAEGELPFSDAGWARWRRAKLIIDLSILFLILGIVAGGTLLAGASVVGDSVVPGVLVLAAGILVPIALWIALRGRGPQVLKITESEITLRFPSEAAAHAIHGHLHAGRAAQPAQVARAG